MAVVTRGAACVSLVAWGERVLGCVGREEGCVGRERKVCWEREEGVLGERGRCVRVCWKRGVLGCVLRERKKERESV